MVMRAHKYADGGKIVKDTTKGDTTVKKSNASPGISGAIKDFIGSAAKSTKVGKDLRTTQQRREEEAGLKNGGKVKRKR